MARRPKEQSEALSLFPFLSILTCLIGTLTMLIAALALRQVSGDPADERRGAEAEARLAAYKEARSLLQQSRLDAERLQRLLDEAAAAERQLRLDAEALLRQRAAREQQAQNDARAARLLAEADRLRTRIAQLTAEIARLTREVESRRAELAARAKPAPATVTVRPSGSAAGLKPHFAECTAESLVLHEAAGAKRVSKAALKSDAAFAALLARVKAQPDATVIFLIRSAGIWTYRDASALAEAAGARHGKLPIVGDGLLDLSLFGVKREERQP